MGKPRGQVAMEYLMIIGIVLVFLLPIWIYVSGLHEQTSQELDLSYAKNAAEQLTDAATLVYSQGEPAKVNVRVYIPGNVESVSLINRSIMFSIGMTSGITDVSAQGAGSLNGTIPIDEGSYWFSVESKGSYVQITQISE